MCTAVLPSLPVVVAVDDAADTLVTIMNRANYQHPDGRWVALSLMLRRIDRTESAGAVRSHVYEVFETPSRAEAAFGRAARALEAKGFARVKKIAGFRQVPLDEWREAGMPAKGAITKTDTRAAKLAKREKAKLFARAHTRGLAPRAFSVPMRALLRDMRGRMARIAAEPGVTLRARWGKPSSPRALAAAEKKLGRALPPSLRAWLAAHDGFRVAWTSSARPWAAELEVLPLRTILRAWGDAKEDLVLPTGEIVVPLLPRVDRAVIGVAVRGDAAAREGCVVECLDPPDGAVLVLAPSFGAFLARAAADAFLLAGRSDTSEDALPAIRRAFARSPATA